MFVEYLLNKYFFRGGDKYDIMMVILQNGGW